MMSQMQKALLEMVAQHVHKDYIEMIEWLSLPFPLGGNAEMCNSPSRSWKSSSRPGLVKISVQQELHHYGAMMKMKVLVETMESAKIILPRKLNFLGHQSPVFSLHE